MKWFITLLLAVLWLAACSSGTAPPAQPTQLQDPARTGAERPPGPAFAEMINDLIEQGQNYGASDEQIGILRDAARAGEVSYEQVRAGQENAQRCLEDAGFSTWTNSDSVIRGWTYPSFSYTPPAGMSEVEAGAVSAQCQDNEFMLLQNAYSQQPVAVEAWEAEIEAHRPAIVACLSGYGVDNPEAMTTWELENTSGYMYTDDLSAGEAQPRDCFAEAGVDF